MAASAPPATTASTSPARIMRMAAPVWRTAVTYVWNKRVKGAYPYQYRRPVRPALEKVYIQP